MKRNILNKINFKIITLAILFVSIVVNVVLIINNYNYKYRAGKELYNNVLNIRTVNETNNEILTNIINVETINNLDLLKLYQNYDYITTSLSDLWYEYSYYVDEWSVFSDKKSINTDITMVSEIHTRIEDFLEILLENEMTTKTYKVNLEDVILEDFQLMKYVSDDIKIYFDEFCEDNLKGLEGEERAKKIIRKEYWVDILEKLNKISNDYIDLDLGVENLVKK